MTMTELEIFELLDFETEVICDAGFCDRAAEWRLVIKCCGKTVLFCTRCKNYMVEYPELRCGRCDIYYRPGRMSYSLIEPLHV